MGMRVEDCGKSECQAVMVWIGIETLSRPKGSPLPRGLSLAGESDQPLKTKRGMNPRFKHVWKTDGDLAGLRSGTSLLRLDDQTSIRQGG